jgi:type 1 glutamine amidotransferase
MKSILRMALFAASFTIPCSWTQANADAADKPHAVFVVGTRHYSPQNSMPVLAGELERHGFRTTVVLPKGDPEQNKNGVGLPGLEALRDADVAVFFMRFLTLADDQFQHVMDYVQSGKPVVGLRTSTHAFLYAQEHPNFPWNNYFGYSVLGTSYVSHLSGETDCRIVERHRDHPVLTGVRGEQFRSTGSLYLTSLQPGCVPLVLGAGRGAAGRVVESQFGTRYIDETETDIVAWTWRNRWGGRVFCTSFGHVGDFGVEPIMRILINGICWAADRPVPPAGAKINTFHVEEEETAPGSKKGSAKN